MIEQWKDIQGYNGNYQISTFGNIKNKSKLLIFRDNNSGYYLVNLYKNGFRKAYTVHRLVALHFIKNTLYKSQVNHKDGNKHNNNIKNLEWVTPQENTQHAVNNGLIKKGVNHHNYGKYYLGRFDKKPIRTFTLDKKLIKDFDSVRSTARYLDQNYNFKGKATDIVKVCKGKRKSTCNFIFEYIETDERFYE